MSNEEILERAMDAPIVRQLFSSSPKDPRYHMLSYLSNKFTQPSDPHVREPRAALFLNRFTRTLPIMFASNGLQNVLGISSDQLHNKSFYYCVQQNCLPEAIRCLESAKANDSIAYLRFWYRDPREEEEAGRTRRNRRRSSPDMDLEEHTPIRRNRNRSSPGSNVDTEEDEDDDGGVSLTTHMDVDHSDHSGTRYSSTGYSSSRNRNAQQPHSCGSSTIGSRPSDLFDREPNQASSASTTSYNEEFGLSDSASPGIELEAVVSCTSDGLVVILRQARPFALDTVRQRPVHYRNGIYASPWALKPILPTPARPDKDHNKGDYLPSGAPIYEPMYSGEDRARTQTPSTQLTPPRADDFMQSIREVAVFAWALTGINGCLEQYSHGAPMAGAAPAYLPVWEPHASGFEQPDMIMSG